MNGIMPGPLWLAIASAANDTSIENGTPTRGSKDDTVTGKKADRDRESMNRQSKSGVDGGAIAASCGAIEMYSLSLLEGGIGEERKDRHGVS